MGVGCGGGDGSPWRLAFRAVDGILRGDARLRARGVRWRSWRGEAGDAGGPEVSEGVWGRLTPLDRGSRWETEGAHRAELGIRVELAAAGTNADELLDAWWEVLRALFPGPEDAHRGRVSAALAAAGVVEGLRVSRSAVEPIPGRGPGSLTRAEGELIVSLTARTGE